MGCVDLPGVDPEFEGGTKFLRKKTDHNRYYEAM